MKTTISVAEGTFFFSSTIIGAGILALPIAAADSGFLPLLAMLCLVAIISLFSAIYIAEAVLASNDSPHLPSLAYEYLGGFGMAAMLIGTMIYIYGALIGYLSVGGQVIFTLSNGYIPVWTGTLLYFTVSASVLLFGLKLVSYIETYLFISMLLLLGAVIVIAFPEVQLPLLLSSHWPAAPDVFGVVLFAYVGHSVIPSIARGLNKRRDIVAVAVLGVLVPLILYILWSAVVMGIVPCVSQGYCLESAKRSGLPATLPLGFIVGGSIIALGNVFAIFSTLTSYIGFAFSLTDEYQNTIAHWGKSSSRYATLAMVISPPLLVSLLNPSGFVYALQVAGTYGGGLFVGILPALMVTRVRLRTAPDRSSKGRILVVPIMVLITYLLGILYVTYQYLR